MTVIKQNNTSEVIQINLPDDNKVWLNSNSSIEYVSGINSERFEGNYKWRSIF